MPPTAGTVGLLLALAGSVCLGAATDRGASPSASRPGPYREYGDERPIDGLSAEASDQLKAALGRAPSDVRHAVFDSPIPQTDPSEPADRESLPTEGGQPAEESAPGALSPPGDDAPVRLSPPGSAPRKQGLDGARAPGLASPLAIAGSLGLVLGLFLVVAWIVRRTVPGEAAALPSEVVEVLGRAALAGKAQVHLVRCGGKLLLVSLSPAGAETLTEITDADEVTRLAGLCHQTRPGSTTAAFRQVLQQFTGQPTVDEVSHSGEVRSAGRGRRGVRGRRGRGLEGYDV